MLTMPAAVASAATVALAAVLLLGGGRPARAEEPLTLLAKIDVGGKGLGAFDISFVDPKIGLYILSDRTNGSVDMLGSEHGHFLGDRKSVV